MKSKICQSCGNVFYKKESESNKYWETKKYCSKECSLKFTSVKRFEGGKGRIVSEETKIKIRGERDKGKEEKGGKPGNIGSFKKGNVPWIKGKKIPQLQRENNPMWKGRVTKNCVICNKEFEVAPWLERKRFCSHDCYHKWHIGRNSPVWTDNYKKKFRNRLMALPEYVKWRSDVFKRDSYTCQDCKESSSGSLEAHHIIPLFQLIKQFSITDIEQARKCKELFEVSNGLTLCRKCHRKTDSYGKQKSV
jgi:hypothetical protein